MKAKISASYIDWLNAQKMPKGKRSAMLSALELFAKQGYDGTSTMAIAENAGISQTTIFKYFKTKQDLLTAILKPLIDNLLPEYRNDFFADIPELSTLRAEIHFLVQNRFHFLMENAAVMMILMTQVMTNSELYTTFFKFVSTNVPVFIKQIYGRLQATGELRDEMTPIMVFRTIGGQLIGYFLQRTKILPDMTVDEAADLKQIEDIIVRAISKS